jgi:hypothetical protein
MMKTTITKRATVVSMVVLFSVLSMQSTQPAKSAEPLENGAMGFALRGERGVIASGAAEDTLKACMARIPEVSSAGQRMLAEQSCVGEEETRSTIRSAPKF